MPWSGGKSKVKNDVEWRGVNGENKVDGSRVEGSITNTLNYKDKLKIY